MTDCPTCHRPVDGLVCLYCRPPAPRNPPIPAAAKARIDAILRQANRRRDAEADEERAAIQEEAA